MSPGWILCICSRTEDRTNREVHNNEGIFIGKIRKNMILLLLGNTECKKGIYIFAEVITSN